MTHDKGMVGLSITAGPIRPSLVSDEMFAMTAHGGDINIFIDPDTARQWRVTLENLATKDGNA